MSKVAEVMARLEAGNVEITGPNDTLADDAVEGATDVEGGATDIVAEVPGGEADKSLVAPSLVAPSTSVAKPVKTPEDERIASRFAALAKAKQENLRIIETARGKEVALQEKERILAAREKELEGQFEKAFADPDALFQAMQTRLGVKSLDDLKRYAEKNWTKPARELPPDEKPLTRAEIAEEFSRREQSSRAQQVYDNFVKLTDDDEKYPAASVLYTPEQRVSIGNRIADEMVAMGDAFTPESIAEELEKRARQEPRYAKLSKRVPSGDASKVDSKASQQGKTAPRIPSGDDATERASANGSGKQSRKDRIAALAARIR